MSTALTHVHTNARHARRPFGRWVVAGILASVIPVLAACGGPMSATATTHATTDTSLPALATDSTSITTPHPPETAATTTSLPRRATIDRLVGAEGARLHVRCTGEGHTTVVLIAGFEGDSTIWTKVEPAIAARARVCSYDRPGTGTSDPPTAVSTFASQASALHDLLQTVNEPGPYVIVGHSFGGAEAVTFASQFPADVVGVVLVDASPTAWPATLCATPDDGSAAAATLKSTCTGAFAPSGNREHLDVRTAFASASEISSLGSVPMVVITATERELPSGLAPTEIERLTEAWDTGQLSWAALSSDARLVRVQHTGHHIELDQPCVVIDEITRIIP